MDSDDLGQSSLVDVPMMDPTMEDLFGEAVNDLGAGLPPVPLPSSLMLRIAEMQHRGCST
jgi:mediator of RNA polymerase II transcription subunit 16